MRRPAAKQFAGFAIVLSVGIAQAEQFPVDPSPVDRAAPPPTSHADVLSNVTPAVVSVFPARLLDSGADGDESDLLDRFFRPGTPEKEGDESENESGTAPEKQEREQGVGSGVIVSSDGYILTNSHVVHINSKLADAINVELADKRRFPAKIIGADPLTDIAVLKIEARNLKALPIGDSDNVRIGDLVLAVGNPFKVGLTATRGMVSALNRSGLNLIGRNGYESFIQMDAAINPGNSGGALVDAEGRLVGINTAILGGMGGNVGIGFAIPSNLACNVAQRLIENGGEITRGFLGVKVETVDAGTADRLNLEAIKGVIVADVLDGSPADKAGLKQDNVILTVNGTPVDDRGAFRLAVSLHQPGDTVKFTGTKTTSATLSDEAGSTTAAAGGDFELDVLEGIRLAVSTEEDTEGLRVTSVDEDSPHKRKFRPDMIITEVNEERVKSFSEAEAAFKKGVNRVRVLEDGEPATLALRL